MRHAGFTARAASLALALTLTLSPAAVWAQQDEGTVFGDGTGFGDGGVLLQQVPNPAFEADSAARAGTGTGAVLRALDKTVGRSSDITLAAGESAEVGRIRVQLLECRYPEVNPASDAYAHIRVFDLEGMELFDGWMIASSPALMALEHSRYDVWVLRCTTSQAGGGSG